MTKTQVAEKGCKSGGAPRVMRKSRSTRWRVLVLLGVHILFAIHLTHWLTTGRTLSPVEPSESMYFIEQGKLNAGFIFFATTLLATAIFGRYFCGWGCHVVALQDLCAAGMKKVGIRPKLFRSRLLMFVPLIIGLEMFVYPIVKQRILSKVVTDPDWAVWFDGLVSAPWVFSNHIITEGFWDTFAGPIMAIPFLFICAFGVVYFLGAKGFCTYGCPYGAFFAGMDRLAPGKIVANLDTCEKCGHCTANCTSNVRVHEEIQIWGKVVSPGCMKCMDCVSVCPTGSLSFGFTKPLVFSKPIEGRTRKPKRYDLSVGEEIGLFILFFAVRYAWRQVYYTFPMLMATGIAACVTFIVWKALRTFRDPDVRLHHFVLKSQGETTATGWAVTAIAGILLALSLVFGVGKWHQEQSEWQYRRLFTRGASLDQALDLRAPPIDEELQAIARRGAHDQRKLRTIAEGGIALYPQPKEKDTDSRLGYFLAIAGDYEAARDAWERVVGEVPHPELDGRYAQLIFRLSYDAFLEGGVESGIAVIQDGIEKMPRSPFLAHRLSLMHRDAGRIPEANKWQLIADQLQADALQAQQEALQPTPGEE